MDTKEALEKAVEDVKKERNWILLESRFIQKLKYAVKVGNYNQTRRFERKAARSERRIHQFEGRVIEILNFLRQRFPTWNNELSELEEKTKIFDGNILKRVSLIDGTIPKLIKQNNYNQINIEIDKVMDEGVRPLIVLLNHLEDQLKIHLRKENVAEEIQEKELDKGTEAYLNRKPFLIIFHSANDKEFVNKILSWRRSLPQYYNGRRLEYAFEVDYFWIEHHGKISAYFGHVAHGMLHLTTRRAKQILEMYRGKTDAEKIGYKRGGLLFPEWLLSRIGDIKLIIEIKAGRGKSRNDERALDMLVEMIKRYHLENNIMFIAFSLWPIAYLKLRLPHAYAIVSVYRPPFLGGRLMINMPFNRPLESLRKFTFLSHNKIPYVDALAGWIYRSEKGAVIHIRQATAEKKDLIGGLVKSKKSLDWLVKHGAKGAFIWKSPETIIEWLRSPPTE